MITMLLVEDESFERTSLATCVDWDLIGIQIIGEAPNGSQGLAKVLEIKPDIVLTVPVLILPKGKENRNGKTTSCRIGRKP